MYYFLIVLLVFDRVEARYEQTAKYNQSGNADYIKIAKCCELDELMVDGRCTPLGETNETSSWTPEFWSGTSRGGRKVKVKEPNFQLRIALPKCSNNEKQWSIYQYPTSPDRLTILTSGKLRHSIAIEPERIKEWEYSMDEDGMTDEEDVHYHDYEFGDYCADKIILRGDKLMATYAIVCVPRVLPEWNYLMKHVIDPTFHAISIICYLIVAVVYFVLPQLRDLVGNMITSMTMCLICSQCADMVRIFTEFSSHVSFLIAAMVMYISLLAAFFWLNSLGYYIWKTFRSRNVFLRVTDGRKYCYYSSYVWSSTISMAAMAIFAHFTLDNDKPIVSITLFESQETFGWLGVAVIFTPVAFTIIINLCFVLTTMNTIKRMSTYGRIHHKMKYSFRMFIFLFIIMSVAWLFLLLSWLEYEVIAYCNIVVNLLQAILILYVCVFSQRRVTFLLRKTCNCCSPGETSEGLDWGEEMMAMNAGY